MLAAAVESAHHIPVWHAIVLGITQGLSEFLPISSSGHLILVPWLFNWTELMGPANAELNKTLDVALHIGTFLGAAGYFRNDLLRFAGGAIRSIRRRAIVGDDERIAWLLVLSAVPGALVGALFSSVIEENLGQIWLIAVMLVVFGIVLLVADRAPERRPVADFRTRDAVIMGVCQAAALQPGVSRSGVTISASRWLEFERDSAARLSFLMSLPIIGGAGLYKGLQLLTGSGLPPGTAGAFFWGMVSSAVTGALAVSLVLRIVRTRSFTPFVVYRAIVGLGALVLLATGVR
ncbi:MAG: undecaprenyl-diphosphate phosphatase [Actinomycetota bacterium]|nr:undecaprenyl-diphosphate phosphatase [Actinomycetota bacterium]